MKKYVWLVMRNLMLQGGEILGWAITGGAARPPRSANFQPRPHLRQMHFLFWTNTLEPHIGKKFYKVSIPKSLISFNPVVMVMMTSRVSKSAFSKGKINCHGLFSKRSDCSSLCKTKLTHFHQKFPNNSYSVKFTVLQTFLYLIYQICALFVKAVSTCVKF